MQSGGASYEHSGNMTEWDDILINRGIRTKEEILIEKGLNPLDYIKNEDIVEDEPHDVNSKLDNLDLDELDELLEDDDSDSKMIEQYRNQRLMELKQAAVKNRFGEVLEISKDEWVREVTDGSKAGPVIVHLYESSMIECQLMDEALRVLATKFKYLKFLRIKYSQAIENWPERNLPTVFIYDNGSLKTQILTLKSVGGLKMNTSDVEWFLVKNGIITDSELQNDPRDDEEEEGRSGMKIVRGRRST